MPHRPSASRRDPAPRPAAEPSRRLWFGLSGCRAAATAEDAAAPAPRRCPSPAADDRLWPFVAVHL